MKKRPFTNAVRDVILVYECMEHAPLKVALTLTCKQMAQIASEVSLSRPYVSAKYTNCFSKRICVFRI